MSNDKKRIKSVAAAKRHCQGKKDPTELISPEAVTTESRLLHALQVYQIELELQNAELSQSRNEVEMVLENYTELYDFAPVGYCTLDPNGVIQRVNLTGATMLGDQRSRLVNRSLEQFISYEDKVIFREMLRIAFNGLQQKALCEVLLHPKGLRSATPVKIVAMTSATVGECLAVLIDITERKRLEAEIMTANDALKLTQLRDQAASLLTLNDRLHLEIDRRTKLEAALLTSQERLRNLSASLQTIREEERKDIAREIHDELGQLLASINFSVSLLAVEFPNNQKLVARSREMETLIGTGIKTVQRIAANLRPAMLDVLGIADALEWQNQEFCKRTRIAGKITILLLKFNVNPDVATALFRVYQEALTNVQRHSGATKVEAYLVERKHTYTLTVRDNGRGVTGAELDSPHSIGFIGIRERAFILGGRVRIFGAPGQGTTLLVRLPVNPKLSR